MLDDKKHSMLPRWRNKINRTGRQNMTIPYVITDDLSLEFSRYMNGNEKGMQIVSEASDIIENSLKKIFPVVDKISAGEIHGFLTDKVSQSALPVISLVGLIPADGCKVISIEASRTVRLSPVNGCSFEFVDNGSFPRYSSLPPISEQFKNAVDFVAQKGDARVNILDDVVFSGNTVANYIHRLEECGLKIDTVITNVALRRAVGKLNSLGINVDADFVYEDVVDEVCMRDFIVGAPTGGRNLMTKEGQYVSVPYLYPFANVDVWASVNTDEAVEFSKDCLRASLGLWEQLAPDTKFGDLIKPVFKCHPEDRIVDTLARMLRKQEYGRFANTL